IAVFSRPGSERAADEAPAAKEFAPFRREGEAARALAEAAPPAWAFHAETANPLSSTALRRKATES
ncbi:MAG: nicotinate-nucleotide adenylyltransferase, partial [Amphiplicatus sp.]